MPTEPPRPSEVADDDKAERSPQQHPHQPPQQLPRSSSTTPSLRSSFTSMSSLQQRSAHSSDSTTTPATVRSSSLSPEEDAIPDIIDTSSTSQDCYFESSLSTPRVALALAFDNDPNHDDSEEDPYRHVPPPPVRSPCVKSTRSKRRPRRSGNSNNSGAAAAIAAVERRRPSSSFHKLPPPTLRDSGGGGGGHRSSCPGGAPAASSTSSSRRHSSGGYTSWRRSAVGSHYSRASNHHHRSKVRSDDHHSHQLCPARTLLRMLCLVGMLSVSLTLLANRSMTYSQGRREYEDPSYYYPNTYTNNVPTTSTFSATTLFHPRHAAAGNAPQATAGLRGKLLHTLPRLELLATTTASSRTRPAAALPDTAASRKLAHHDKTSASEGKSAAQHPSEGIPSQPHPHLSAVVLPQGKLVEPHFPAQDRNLYTFKAPSSATKAVSSISARHRRVVVLHESIRQVVSSSSGRRRRIALYASDYTDPTQLYGVLDSSDERVAHTMERRPPLTDGECVPMRDWQTTFHPSCNGVHEVDLSDLGRRPRGTDLTLFGTKGYWRNAWRVDVPVGGSPDHRRADTVVLKTLKYVVACGVPRTSDRTLLCSAGYAPHHSTHDFPFMFSDRSSLRRIEHRFEEKHFENNRVDAVAMERLTSSPHVINVFGFCGNSVVTEYADGKRLGELADKNKKVPLSRLRIAADIASGLADVHGIDGDDGNNATFVHLDINPANVVSIGGTLKLNDFNIGIVRRWNTTSNTPCGFPAQYPNPQWRSPEEARGESDLTEKVDVFSMGHIFFRLICGHEPWNKLEPGGKPSKNYVNARVEKGILPTIPKEIRLSKDPEEVAIRQAMLRCYTFDPAQRPSAREIANFLRDALQTLDSRPTTTTSR